MRFKIQNQHTTIINFNIIFHSWILRIKDKITVPIHKVHQWKISIEKFMNETVSNPKVESTLTRTKQPTNQSNNGPNNTIQLWNLYKNQVYWTALPGRQAHTRAAPAIIKYCVLCLARLNCWAVRVAYTLSSVKIRERQYRKDGTSVTVCSSAAKRIVCVLVRFFPLP